MNNTISLWTSCGFCVNENKVWFVPHDICILVCYDLNNQTIERVVELPNASASEMESLCVVKADDYIIVIPACGDKIYKYNSLNGELKSVCVCNGDLRIKYVEASVIKDRVIMFPFDFESGIVAYDWEKDLLEKIESEYEIKNVIYSWNNKRNVLFVTLDNHLYRLIVDGMKIERFDDPNVDEKYQTIFESHTGVIYAVNSVGILYEVPDFDFKRKRIIANLSKPIVGVSCSSEHIWLLPSEGLTLFRFDLEKQKLEEVTIDNDTRKKNMNGFSRAFSVSDGFVFMHTYTEKIYKIYNNMGIVKSDVIYKDVSKTVKKSIIDVRMKNKGCVNEDMLCDLQSYLKYMCEH